MAPPAVQAVAPPVHPGLKVLIVDDNATNRRILSTMFEGWGMHTTSVTSAEQALDQLSTAEKFDDPYKLVLTDIHMPKMDGFGLVRQLKTRLQNPIATIMMLTSGGQPSDVARCAELGVGAYVLKPVRKEELYQAMLLVLQAKT